MTREDREQDIEEYIAWLERLADAIAGQAPNARLVALGFSQGAATVSRWVTASERAFSRLILWGSDLPPDLDWARARPRFAAIEPWFVIGDRDEFATADRLARQEARLEAQGVPHRIVRSPGGPAIDRAAHAELDAQLD
jgi:predicted esterase